MSELVALDYPLGPALVRAIQEIRDRGDAFCVLDQRTSGIRRAHDLKILAPTHVWSADGSSTPYDGAEVDDGTGLVMLTSGSSGTPKAALLSWDALGASAALTSAALQRGGPSVWLACLPPCHIGGLAVLLRHILANDGLLFGEITNGPERGATHVAVVRTQLQRYALSDYACVLLGGARPPEGVAPHVITTWGMTETGSGVVYDRTALPGVSLALRDGELLVKSPTLFSRYRHAPRPRVDAPDGTSGWFPTGDGAEIDNGVLRVRGRLDYVITSGGEKIWPDDIEALFVQDPQLDIAISSRPDDEWGEIVVALVAASAPCDDEIRSRCRDYIGPWAAPKEVVYVPAIPRTANGKIDRSACAKLATA